MLKSAVLVLLLAAASPAHASDWFYVDSSKDLSNISFVDKDSIRQNADGNSVASMYSVLAEEEDGAVAYRFTIEVECRSRKSHLVAAEIFDPKLVSGGITDMNGDWEPVDPGTQGDTITAFICSKGANATVASAGSALPFDKGRAMLAEMRAKEGK